jgi:hypothetical protein
MSRLKKLLFGSAVIILPGGLLVAAGYFLYKKFGGSKNGIHVEASDSNSAENSNEDRT